MSSVFISTLQTAEGRFPAHRSSSRSAPDAIKSRLFSHRSTPRSSAKAPVSGLGPPPRKATPEVQNFLHLLAQHRSQRATSTRLPRSCSQCPPECPSQDEHSTVWRSNYVFDLGGAKRARTADLLHAMGN